VPIEKRSRHELGDATILLSSLVDRLSDASPRVLLHRSVRTWRPPSDPGLILTCLAYTNLWWITVTAAISSDTSSSTNVVPSTLHWLLRAIQGRRFVRGDYLCISSTTVKGSDPDYLNANLLDGLGDGYSSREEEEVVVVIHEGSKTLHENMRKTRSLTHLELKKNRKLACLEL
jgi:hypothetical protein